MSEQKWIQAAKGGDQAAFCHLYGLYKDRLYRYAYYKLGNREDAEDAVSECVLSAWKQIGSLREHKAFPAWIFRILSGCCNAAVRKSIADRDVTVSAAARMSGCCAPHGPAKADGAAGTLIAPAADQPSALRLILAEALEQLAEQEQEIVLMAAVGGLKSTEIAEITGLSPGGVRSKLSRSLARMRRYLESE